MVHTHNGILLSYKKNTFESVLMRWMNLEPIIQSEISQKEKDRSYIIAYICNLERWYQLIYLQGSNGGIDIESRLKDTGGWEGRRG